ncbi:hypothetical protein P3X46_026667 [Hevea brasiliensis]|uniref:Transmembrane protein n=1 Tax=Hevea brasiliensis TaxID=3981 RepID=A0ABQ9L0B7_HEVBR|nr:hypothetical protein P3X46_026667 [Hevea brasiliensis]
MQEQMEKRSSSRSRKMKIWLFGKLKIKESWRWRWRFLGSAFKWKRIHFQLSFVDDVLFKIVSVFEAIVLVATLCFFYLCCGCHI